MPRRPFKLIPGGATESGHSDSLPAPHAPNDAFIDDLFRRYRHSLQKYLNRLTHDTGESEEIIQETYLRLIRVDKLDRLDAKARSYIFSIATNLLRDRWRYDRARLRDRHVSVADMDFPSDSPLLEQLVDWDKALCIVRSCLQELQPRTQQVFVLHAVEGLAFAEIAGVLGVSGKTVKRDFAMALELCQQRLKAVLD